MSSLKLLSSPLKQHITPRFLLTLGPTASRAHTSCKTFALKAVCSSLGLSLFAINSVLGHYLNTESRASCLDQHMANSNVYSIATAALCSLVSVKGPVSNAPLSLRKQCRTEMNHRGRRKGENVSPPKERRRIMKQSGERRMREKDRGSGELK